MMAVVISVPDNVRGEILGFTGSRGTVHHQKINEYLIDTLFLTAQACTEMILISSKRFALHLPFSSQDS
jgi:hypothetical protein